MPVRLSDLRAHLMGRLSKDIALIRQFFVIPPKVMVDTSGTLRFIATRNDGVTGLESFIYMKIADLICDNKSHSDVQCDLVVSGDMSVRQALTIMQKNDSNLIRVRRDDGSQQTVLSKEDVLTGLLAELDVAQSTVIELQQQINSGFEGQLALVQESMDELMMHEKTTLEVAVDYLTEGLIILDVNGKVKRANPCSVKLLGLDEKCHEDQIEEQLEKLGFMKLLEQDDNNKNPQWGEYNVKNSDEKILQIRWSEINSNSGQTLGKVVMLNDVTNEQADEKAKAEFIASITHELRTPLTIIQNSVSNILVGVTGKVNSKARQYLEGILSDCHRFGNLISDLLDMSKIETGNISIERSVVKLPQLIEETISNFADKSSAKKIKMSQRIEECIPMIYVDRRRIYQVLFNLLNNAIKYTDEGGHVVVAAYQRDNDVVVVVEDTGMGILPNMQKQIFNKFHQIGRTAGAGYKGIGLGLPICNGIISLHGGDIWVESQPSKGSKFYFSLPKTDPAFMLNRNITEVSKQFDKTHEQFALALVEFRGIANEAEHEKIDDIAKELIISSSKFLTGNSDIVLRTSESEIFFVIVGSQKIVQVKKEINKVLAVNGCNSKEHLFEYALGAAVYPNDVGDIIEMENLVRLRAGEIF